MFSNDDVDWWVTLRDNGMSTAGGVEESAVQLSDQAPSRSALAPRESVKCRAFHALDPPHTLLSVSSPLPTCTMSKAAVEQALTGLIPALNGPLPVELVELASSLLARSRSVANSLKSDEEIARPYACAQLACERYECQLCMVNEDF